MGNNKLPFFKSLLIGLMLFICPVVADEWETIKKAAEQGDAKSQFYLGIMYNHGRGVPEDDIEAMRWFQMAAAQGDTKAMFNVGMMYAEGGGAPKDDAEAVRWFRMAAEQGDAEAQGILGIKYALGEGVPKDYVQAYAWLITAVAQGNEHVRESMEKVAERLSPDQFGEAVKLLQEYEAYVSSQGNE